MDFLNVQLPDTQEDENVEEAPPEMPLVEVDMFSESEGDEDEDPSAGTHAEAKGEVPMDISEIEAPSVLLSQSITALKTVTKVKKKKTPGTKKSVQKNTIDGWVRGAKVPPLNYSGPSISNASKSSESSLPLSLRKRVSEEPLVRESPKVRRMLALEPEFQSFRPIDTNVLIMNGTVEPTSAQAHDDNTMQIVRFPTSSIQTVQQLLIAKNGTSAPPDETAIHDENPPSTILFTASNDTTNQVHDSVKLSVPDIILDEISCKEIQLARPNCSPSPTDVMATPPVAVNVNNPLSTCSPVTSSLIQTLPQSPVAEIIRDQVPCTDQLPECSTSLPQTTPSTAAVHGDSSVPSTPPAPQEFINRRGIRVNRNGTVAHSNADLSETRVLGNTIVFDANDEELAVPLSPLVPTKSISTLLQEVLVDPSKEQVRINLQWNGENEVHSMGTNMLFSSLIEKLSKREKCDPAKILLLDAENKVIDSNETPASISHKPWMVISGRIMENIVINKRRNVDNSVQLQLQAAKLKKRVAIKVNKMQTFETIILEIIKVLEVNYDQVKLFFDGDRIDPEETPQALELTNGDIIDVDIV